MQLEITRRFSLILVTVLMIYGFVLRLFSLQTQSLWIDEAFMITAAHAILDRGVPILASGFWYLSGLLHAYLTAGFIFVFSPFGDIFASRFLSVLLGTVTIFLVYLFGRKIGNERVGILAAFFIAFSLWEISWSRQARMYQLFQLLYLFSLYFFYRFTVEKRVVFFWLTAVMTFLALLTHNLAITLLLAYVLYSSVLLLLRKENLFQRSLILLRQTFNKLSLSRHFTILFLVLGMGLLLALGFVAVSNYHYIFLNYLPFYWSYLRYTHFSFFLLAIPGIFLLLHREMRAGLLFAFSILIPFFFVSFAVYLLHYRYLYFFSPLLVLLASFFLDKIVTFLFSRKIVLQQLFLMLMVCILATSGFTFVPKESYALEPLTPQPDFSSLYAYLEERISANDVVIDAYPAVNKLYLNHVDYGLKFSLSGREIDIVNKTHDVYTGTPFIDLAQLKELKSCWIIADKLALGRIGMPVKEYITTLQLVNISHEATSLQVWRCG